MSQDILVNIKSQVVRTYELLQEDKDLRIEQIKTALGGNQTMYSPVVAQYNGCLDSAAVNRTALILEQLQASDAILNNILDKVKTANDELETALENIASFATDTSTAARAVGIGLEIASSAGFLPEETADA